MSGLFKFVGLSAVSVAVCALVGVADAATGRAGYSNVRATGPASVARMPSMPTLPINSVGNISTDVPTGGTNVVPEPPVEPECPDGGVKNSAYTVDMCMDDVLRCINNGALPNGLNNLFNEEVRHAVENGMGLCISQIEKCVTDVRRDCANVYRSAADVWIDFNSRKVQPEYYNFVLRKTGLTPNQAENTCRLLDKNTYGASFAAVADDGTTTAEYNKTVGAYNSQQGNRLVKTNPQGVEVNDGNTGVDGSRGHYARWDAETATCLIRVAAYNKDKHISNSWLFGAAGNDKPAEVWKAAGDTFSCNKDLFGFSLMNDTSTVAVVGIGGGTVLGAGIGAIAGHGKREFDCARPKHRELLMEELKDEELKDGRVVGILNEYIQHDVDITQKSMDEKTCGEIVKLFDEYYQYETEITECKDAISFRAINMEFDETNGEEAAVRNTASWCLDEGHETIDDCKKFLNSECEKAGSVEACERLLSSKKVKFTNVSHITIIFDTTNGEEAALASTAPWCVGNGHRTIEACKDFLKKRCDDEGDINKCMSLLLEKGVVFTSDSQGTETLVDGQMCVTASNAETKLVRLNSVFGKDITNLMINGEKSNMAKSVGIGAAVGAGTGGLATAITAFVERNNISCRVGDGLEQVAFNKSYSIDTLKDFYVKWNLRVPDVVAPTATITDCQSWKNTCATFADLEQCAAAQFNYKPAGASTTILVSSVCTVSGSACIENYKVAHLYRACP